MANEKRRVKVVINEKEYTIISNKSAAHIELVAETINKQLKELSALSNKLSKEEQAILMAVNAVSDQIDSHTKMIELEEDLKQMERN
ncbi:MAG TPA: cell division protein ZapA [Atopostipes sp.]|nr:cell division protein ZapA [Atopostipes sp.]